MSTLSKSNVFIVVGTPGSGKDILIKAVNDLGTLHAKIVPKHTSRKRQDDDGAEMICSDDPDYDLDGCDITYGNYKAQYGIKSDIIWDGIRAQIAQVLVISNINAINKIKRIIGPLVKVIFISSELSKDAYEKQQKALGNDDNYVKERVNGYEKAVNVYYDNFQLFDHVLINAESEEDLFDQIFRLFDHYERGI